MTGVIDNLGATARLTGGVEPEPAVTGAEMSLTDVNKAQHSDVSSAAPSRSRQSRLRERLSERDTSLLSDLARLRLLTGKQVERLYLSEGSPQTRARRARAMLQKLTKLKLLVRMERRVGGIRAGSDGYIYGLSGLGRAVLEADEHPSGRTRREREVSPRLQSHMLYVSELYVKLVVRARASDLELLTYEAEPPSWRKYPGRHSETVTLKPDAYVQMGIGDVERSLFLEVDLGTEGLATLTTKLKAYVAYWRTGLEVKRRGVFPQVLWLVISERRVQHLNKLIAGLPPEAQKLFRVATLADAEVVLNEGTQLNDPLAGTPLGDLMHG